MKLETGLNQLGMGSAVGFCEHRNESFEFLKAENWMLQLNE
jgi:hypothetical protein